MKSRACQKVYYRIYIMASVTCGLAIQDQFRNLRSYQICDLYFYCAYWCLYAYLWPKLIGVGLVVAKTKRSDLIAFLRCCLSFSIVVWPLSVPRKLRRFLILAKVRLAFVLCLATFRTASTVFISVRFNVTCSTDFSFSFFRFFASYGRLCLRHVNICSLLCSSSRSSNLRLVVKNRRWAVSEWLCWWRWRLLLLGCFCCWCCNERQCHRSCRQPQWRRRWRSSVEVLPRAFFYDAFSVQSPLKVTINVSQLTTCMIPCILLLTSWCSRV